MVVRGARASGYRLARWFHAPVPHARVRGTGAERERIEGAKRVALVTARAGCRGAGSPAGSGCGVMSSVGVSSMGWGGRQAPVGLSAQLPAALMDRPMMGPAQQDQVGQVGGAAVQPVQEMMGFAPGQGAAAAREDTAAVTDGQGAVLGGGDDPAGPPDVQRLAGRPAQGRGSMAAAARSHPARPSGGRDLGSVGRSHRRQDRSAGSWSPRWWLVGWRVTRTRVTVPSQASRRHPSGSRGPTPPRSPARAARAAEEAVQVHGHQQLGADPTGPGQPTRLPGGRRASSVRASAVRWPPLRCRRPRPGGPTVPGRPARSGRPRAPAAHRWPPCRPRSGTATGPGGDGGARPGPARRSGSATATRWPTACRNRGGSRRRAASTRTGSASATVWAGRSWVPWANTAGVGGRELPGAQRLGGLGEGAAEQGPGGPHRTAGRPGTQAQPAAQPPGGRALLDAPFGPGGPAGVHVGQLGQPLAFHPVPQPPQHLHPLGPHRCPPARTDPGRWPARRPPRAAWPGRPGARREPWGAGRRRVRTGVRVHGRNLSGPHQNTSTNPKMWTTPVDTPARLRPGRREPVAASPLAGGRPSCSTSASSPTKRATVPGNCLGPDPPPPRPAARAPNIPDPPQPGPTDTGPRPTPPAPRTGPEPARPRPTGVVRPHREQSAPTGSNPPVDLAN